MSFTDEKGRNLLHFVLEVLQHDDILLSVLLHTGSILNAPNRKGFALLHYACIFGLRSSLDILLQQPNLMVNIMMPPNYITALDLACFCQDEKMVEKLLRCDGINVVDKDETHHYITWPTKIGVIKVKLIKRMHLLQLLMVKVIFHSILRS